MIGAGSASFGRGQIADILQSPEMRDMDVTLSLLDVNEESLVRMYNLSERMKEYTGANVTLEKTTDRKEALKGADYIISSIAVRRMELWEQDHHIPMNYGFRHWLAENGGPAGAFHALRNLKEVIPICRDVERICPDAWFLNFTNPEPRLLHAILHLTEVKAAGFCHGIYNGIDFIANMMDIPSASLDVTSGGINHLYVIKKIVNRDTGKDIIEEVKKKALEYEGAPPLFKKMIEIYDVFLFPNDGHIGEFLPFADEFLGTKWPFGIESKKLGQEKKSPWLSPEDIAEYAEGKRPIDDEVAGPSHEATVPVICDIELDRGNRREAVNVLNTGGYISNLQETAAIEIPAVIDKEGLHPEDFGEVPEPFAAYIRRQNDIIALITEAYRTGSRNTLLQALLMDPQTRSISETEAMMNDMLDAQKVYLPEFN